MQHLSTIPEYEVGLAREISRMSRLIGIDTLVTVVVAVLVVVIQRLAPMGPG